MQHSHSLVLSKFYNFLQEGNATAAADLGDTQFSFQVPGRSTLAGKYDRATFGLFLEKLNRRGYSFEVHDILSSDLHSTVILTEKIDGKEMRAVHVWRFASGKPLAGYLYPRDLYAFDQAWS